jgi:hypothetical protein
MGKKRFKIIEINGGDSPTYDTKIKTWFGWVSFVVFYKTIVLHVLSQPTGQKSGAYNRIHEYCKARGLNENDIVISEVSK